MSGSMAGEVSRVPQMQGRSRGKRLIPLSVPDISLAELEAIDHVMRSPRLSSGPSVEAFEAAFAQYLGRNYAVAVPSGTLGLLVTLAALEIGRGHEVIAPSYSFRETPHAIVLRVRSPLLSISIIGQGPWYRRRSRRRFPRTRAILARNTNGHPAQWDELRAIAKKHNLLLIEDSTEAIGSRYKNAPVGTFGDVSIFDFSQPSPLTTGEGGMIVTDESNSGRPAPPRSHRLQERASVVVGSAAPYQAGMSEIAAALGLAQLRGSKKFSNAGARSSTSTTGMSRPSKASRILTRRRKRQRSIGSSISSISGHDSRNPVGKFQRR